MRCTHSQLIRSIEEFSHASTDSHFQQNDLSHSITQKSVSKLFQSRSWFSLRNSSNIFRFYFFFFFFLVFLFCFVFLLFLCFYFVFRFSMCLFVLSVALLFCSYQAASLLICLKDTTGICKPTSTAQEEFLTGAFTVRGIKLSLPATKNVSSSTS